MIIIGYICILHIVIVYIYIVIIYYSESPQLCKQQCIIMINDHNNKANNNNHNILYSIDNSSYVAMWDHSVGMSMRLQACARVARLVDWDNHLGGCSPDQRVLPSLYIGSAIPHSCLEVCMYLWYVYTYIYIYPTLPKASILRSFHQRPSYRGPFAKGPHKCS